MNRKRLTVLTLCMVMLLAFVPLTNLSALADKVTEPNVTISLNKTKLTVGEYVTATYTMTGVDDVDNIYADWSYRAGENGGYITWSPIEITQMQGTSTHQAYQGGWVEFYVEISQNREEYLFVKSIPCDGWLDEYPDWSYYQNGVAVNGWLNDRGTWYYMSAGGYMQTGWVKDGNWYYMGSNGAMQTGWVKDSGKWYYMNSNGAMKTGWVADGGHWYYMASSGAMKTGWVEDGGSWYFMNANGTIKTGWLQQGSTWYYLLGSGAMATGTHKIDGKYSTFDAGGAWLGYK